MVVCGGDAGRFRAVEYASLSFLSAVQGMCRRERPQDIDYLLRLADTLLEAHEQSMAQVSAAADDAPAGAMPDDDAR